jgi:hypothetical protein
LEEKNRSVSIATSYKLDICGSTPGREKIFLFSVASRDPPSFPSSGDYFPRGKAAEGG